MIWGYVTPPEYRAAKPLGPESTRIMTKRWQTRYPGGIGGMSAEEAMLSLRYVIMRFSGKKKDMSLFGTFKDIATTITINGTTALAYVGDTVFRVVSEGLG